MKKSYRLKPRGLLYVASPCGPSTKFIQIMSLGPKMPPPPPPPPNLKLSFAEYGDVTYQIKGYAAYDNILANILLLHLLLTPGMESKG